MSIQTVGTLETVGFVPAYVAADAMMKAADVEIIGREQVATGIVAVTVCGDIGSVLAALDAGVEVLERTGDVVETHVVPRPGEGLGDLFLTGEAAVKPVEGAVQVVVESDEAIGE